MEDLKARISTKDLVSPGQIGWVYFTEGHIEIAAKVLKSNEGALFMSLPTVRRAETKVRVVNYASKEVWLHKSRALCAFFIREVGDEFVKAAKPLRPAKNRQVKLSGDL